MQSFDNPHCFKTVKTKLAEIQFILTQQSQKQICSWCFDMAGERVLFLSHVVPSSLDILQFSLNFGDFEMTFVQIQSYQKLLK